MILALNGINLSELSRKFREAPNHDMELRFAAYPGGFQLRMTESEALAILNIGEDEIMHLSHDMVKKKHRRCMLVNHPDKGGSPYVAMKINQARDVLEKSYMLKR